MILAFIRRWAARNAGRPIRQVTPAQFQDAIDHALLEGWLAGEVEWWDDAAVHAKNADARRRWAENAAFYRAELQRHREKGTGHDTE